MNTRRENAGRKSKSESEAYWPVRVRDNGQAFWLLLTDKEVDRAAKRALNNPEDMPTLWQRLRLVFGI